MTFSPPDNALGAELLWWREDGNRHTLVTIAGPLLAPRMDARGARTSTLAVTNPSVALDYDRTAPYVIRLTSTRGDELVHRGTLAPHATMLRSIAELFPAFEGELAVATVESAFDLASMHLTIDTRSGVEAAEHLMAIAERVDGVVRRPCGA